MDAVRVSKDLEKSNNSSDSHLPELAKVETHRHDDQIGNLQHALSKTVSNHPLEQTESHRPISRLKWFLICVALYSKWSSP
jgi:hypothetical protein